MVTDPLQDLPGYALRRASAAFMAKLAARLATLELRPAEATVLLVIGANPGVTQSEIGRLLDIASANMAPLAARLSDRDLIVRDALDRRSHGLKLSDSGRRLMNRVRRIVDELESDLLVCIPPAQRAAFLSGLKAVAKALGD
jgi:DNA-binding MarR family transcriptional regulator